VFIDWSVSTTIEEHFGIDGLRAVRESLTPEQARELVRDLQGLDAEREPLEEILHRVEVQEERTIGWQSRLMYFFKRMTGSRTEIEEIVERSQSRVKARMRLLICDLAIRAYHFDHGSHPQQLRELVPEYLSAVPEDPFSGEPPIYRRTPTGCQLYSVGYNRRDDGGQKPPPTNFFAGDILLDDPAEDEPTRPGPSD
jgi:hypothetical protein